MQSKVSIVVPCYNKEPYIGAMLDSVLAQEWDNIELVLVNDGSTDGTRDVILSYLPRFAKRGYEVKLIDQENGGCCKAVHTGLVHMTGEYYCLIDADDEVEPAYVSRMAGWLDEHRDYEWTACNYRCVKISDGKKTISDTIKCPFPQDCDDLLIHHIFRRVITAVWVYMMRVSYMHKCGLIENFCTARSKTYEPLIVIPAAAFGGKLKFFDEPLYRYNTYASDLYGFDSLEKAKAYNKDYVKMYEWAIQHLNIRESEKKRLRNMARLSYSMDLHMQLSQIMYNQSRVLAAQTLDVINEIGNYKVQIDPSALCDYGYEEFFRAIENRYLIGNKSFRRIIGYGALGANSNYLLPQLLGTPYCPTELWDAAGNGKLIKQPDFPSLSADDLLLVFPSKRAIVKELKEKLKDTEATVYYKQYIEYYLLAELKYPQLREFEV